ncbi:hypothetical protein TcasGA2_TC033852 [Tribolium castaneum]|uniref:Uncharacterized protein n=1 Tax=Tribolium castaneum TaxID=7070 RepID=A0A139WF16_TRICA|nr:hypothetical protein TcasGA2_TC033852 [Tribolium castaneum]
MSKYAIFVLAQFILLNEIHCCCLPPPTLPCALPAPPALSCGLPALPPTCALPLPPAVGCAPPPMTILPMPMPVAPALPPTCGLPLLQKKLLLSKLLGLKMGLPLAGCGLPLPPLACGC